MKNIFTAIVLIAQFSLIMFGIVEKDYSEALAWATAFFYHLQIVTTSKDSV
jgi:hypothetical protein